MSDVWWDCILLCCSEIPDRRPKMNEVRQELEGFVELSRLDELRP